jgi:poly(3-hydroxybutyrate) depolymerase
MSYSTPLKLFLITGFPILLSTHMAGQQQDNLQLKKAQGSPMQYFLSLPTGWQNGSIKKWPVVVVFEAAEKEYKKNAARFVAARGAMPFIIAAPFITTNGQQGLRDPAVYPYTPAIWDSIERMTTCRFDMDGIRQVIKDVQQQYNGSEKVYMTGFEAGTHLLWALLFQHPELLYAAAPVAGNYRERCMENGNFSTDPSRTGLPVKNFTGVQDTLLGVKGKLYNQYELAKKQALAHGFRNFSEEVIPGKGHVPMPAEVLNYFLGLWNRQQKEHE